ncbi:MAG: response regulator [Magnetococcales bacterium]|nr:response regulator [Magnetococcales bacterium]
MIASNRTVLIVDDKSDNREILTVHLSRFGFSCLEASDVPGAFHVLHKLGSEAVNVIFLDWMLPGMSGLDMYTAMRHHPEFCSVPIVIVTARIDTVSREQVAKAGVVHFLAKPFGKQQVRKVLEQVFPEEVFA